MKAADNNRGERGGAGLAVFIIASLYFSSEFLESPAQGLVPRLWCIHLQQRAAHGRLRELLAGERDSVCMGTDPGEFDAFRVRTISTRSSCFPPVLFRVPNDSRSRPTLERRKLGDESYCVDRNNNCLAADICTFPDRRFLYFRSQSRSHPFFPNDPCL